MRRRPTTSLVHASATALAGLLLCACGHAPQIGQKAPDTYQPGGPYRLSAEEQALDCKKITGRMQIRILSARDGARSRTSAVSRATQSVVTPVFGGTSHGADPDLDAARDRAYLEAMNRQLATKNCPTFDLESELQPRPIRDTPTPVPKR